MKEGKDRAKIKKGSKKMDVEQIVNTLVKEPINNIKWTGKMPKGVYAIEKQPHPFPSSMNRQMTITLKDRIDYYRIKKICKDYQMAISKDDDVEMDEKGCYPITFHIRSEKPLAYTEFRGDADDNPSAKKILLPLHIYITVERDAFSFSVEEYERDGKPEKVKNKIKQKMMGVIKKYLSTVYGGD